MMLQVLPHFRLAAKSALGAEERKYHLLYNEFSAIAIRRAHSDKADNFTPAKS
jgi:hypothetical protein